MADGVPGATLAALLDLDERTIRKFAVSGIMVRAGKGQYALGPSVRNYVRHLREAAAGRQGLDARLNVVDESALLKREQRRNFELKNAVLANAAVPVDAIEPAWARVVRAVRSAMLAVPGRARFQLPHLTAHDAEVLAEIVRGQLEAAALSDKPPPAEGVADIEDE